MSVSSKTVLISYHADDPNVGLSATEDLSAFKMFVCDTGLFVTLMFKDRDFTENIIYEKLLNDKLSANLGYLYENAVAQAIASTDRTLYYHTWREEDRPQYYEVDFLLSSGTKIVPMEVKSSGLGKHESIVKFGQKYSKQVGRQLLLSQKDVGKEGMLKLYLSTIYHFRILVL